MAKGILTVRIDDKERDRLTAVARERGLTVSHLVREAVKASLDSDGAILPGRVHLGMPVPPTVQSRRVAPEGIDPFGEI